MENVNNQQQLSNASNLDEWGEYAGNKELVDICQDGVMEAVQKHNPAITSVSVRFRSLRGENVDIDWEAAGLCVGKSLHLRRLLVDFEGPQERIQSFCEGMVLNRSIEALEVHFHGDDVNFLEETIQSLQPFFLSINKLVSVKFMSGNQRQERFIPTNGIQMAIDACQSLKSITIDSFCDVGALAQSICRKPGLSHVSFHDSRISHSTCIEIKNMLLNETCTLKSFVFDVVEVRDKFVMTAIADGLAGNKSVKCLKLTAASDLNYQDTSIPFLLTSLEGHSLELLEKVDFKNLMVNVNYAELGPAIAAVLPQMHNLRYLDLSWLVLEEQAWRSIFSALFGTSSQLSELRMSRSIMGNALLQLLGRQLANNTSLKVLDLSASMRISQAAWCSFFNSIQSSQLEEIDILGADIERQEDNVLQAISSFLVSRQNMKVLKISVGQSITIGVWRSFCNVLQSHASLEEINIDNLDGFEDRMIDDLISTLNSNSNMKRVSLNVCSMEQLRAVAQILTAPTCSIEKLAILFVDMNRVDIAPVVDALQRNSSLTELEVDFLEVRVRVRELVHNWSELANLICDTTGINATYQSNHTIQSLSLQSSREMIRYPIKVLTNLHINQNPNKHAVAIKKILENHSMESINFESPVLPRALAVIGNADVTNGLSQMYGILRSSPDLIQRNKKKES